MRKIGFELSVLLCLLPVVAAAEHRPLLPRPQKVRYGNAQLPLRGLAIRFGSVPSAEDRFAAQQLAAGLAEAAGAAIPVLEGAAPGKAIVLTRTGAVAALPENDERPGPQSREAYSIRVTAGGAEIRARSSAGLFYGVQTVRQLVEGSGTKAAFPEVEIEDWPGLAYRGFMMDLSHGPLLKEEEIKRQIDFLARWKANQYYFYSEASIELKGYPLLNPGARYSQQQVGRIVAYARERHVDVVPCLEYYGHLHDMFRIERYADLSALPHGGEFNPRHPRVRAILEDWIGQMAAIFPSPWFHVGLDEPFELEAAGSEAAGGVAPARLYLEMLQNVAAMVRSHGRRMMFWADVATGAEIFVRYPELVSELPRDTIAAAWDYEIRKDYGVFVKPFRDARVPHVIATGLWIWDEVAPDFNRTFANIDGFLADARKYGTLGIINTGWHDSSQAVYRMALPGLAYGAVAGWEAGPVDRENFFRDYALLSYPEALAAEVAPALEFMNRSRQHLEDVLGRDTMHRFWEDPLAPHRLERAAGRQQELRQARLEAEQAEEHLLRALERKPGDGVLRSLLLGARMLDYLGQKHIYAAEIAGYFRRLGSNPRSADVYLFLARQASLPFHSRAADMMDRLSDLRDDYRAAWEAENNPYRLGTVLARWDAEIEYWRRLQARLWEFADRFKDGDSLPPLESLRPSN